MILRGNADAALSRFHNTYVVGSIGLDECWIEPFVEFMPRIKGTNRSLSQMFGRG